MARALSIALTLALVVAALGCGSDGEAGSTTTSAASGDNGPSTGTEAKACVPSLNDTDLSACRDSYDACSEEAKEKVQDFVAGKSPPLDVVAAERANSTYTETSTVQAATAGCLAALLDEYNQSGRDSGTPPAL